MNMDKVIYLNCSFHEKEQVKALGAKWDVQERKWYIPAGISHEIFSQWIEIDAIVNSTEDPLANQNLTHGIPQYGIKEFLNRIQKSFYQLYPTEIWLIGQITRLKDNGKGINIQLMDEHSSEYSLDISAWRNYGKMMKEKLHQNGVQLEEGLLVRLKVRPEFRGKYHVTGDIKDIDPTVSLGQLALLQKQLKEKLIKEGVYAKNKKLPPPKDYCRVFVIHPSNASSYHDFKKIADILEKRGLCKFTYFSSSFEGTHTETEILSAFKRAQEEHQTNPLDALVLIRGGGARSGLLSLVKESIIRNICLFPVPVLVGLGHTDDKLLLDEVANISLGTPSVVISHIREGIKGSAEKALTDFKDIEKEAIKYLRENLVDVSSLESDIQDKVRNKFDYLNRELEHLKENIDYSKQICSQMKKQISQWYSAIEASSRSSFMEIGHSVSLFFELLLSKKQEINAYFSYISKLHEQIHSKSVNYLSRMEELIGQSLISVQDHSRIILKEILRSLEHLQELIHGCNFETILKRGYAIAFDLENKVIHSSKQAQEKKCFRLHFYDGDIQVAIQNTKQTGE